MATTLPTISFNTPTDNSCDDAKFRLTSGTLIRFHCNLKVNSLDLADPMLHRLEILDNRRHNTSIRGFSLRVFNRADYVYESLRYKCSKFQNVIVQGLLGLT